MGAMAELGATVGFGAFVRSHDQPRDRKEHDGFRGGERVSQRRVATFDGKTGLRWLKSVNSTQ